MSRKDFKAPNGDNEWDDFSGLYSKGLKQAHKGVVKASSADAFVEEIMRGKTAPRPFDPALFERPDLELGNNVQSGKLNGPQGAFASHFAGKRSSQDYSTVAPPKVGSKEYGVELAELYWASMLRDVPFNQYATLTSATAAGEIIAMACKDLSKHAQAGLYLGPVDVNGKVTPSLLFRGGAPANTVRDYDPAHGFPQDPNSYFAGETVGPYVSQLCLVGTNLGAQSLNQQINVFDSGNNYMTDPAKWIAVQNGMSPGFDPPNDPTPRHVRNGRDLASFTRIDELYQAYLVAFLVMANTWKKLENPSLPYATFQNQKPFGTMGGPDVAAFLGLVAREAINAVWWQKWAVHLRARPEAAGGLVHLKRSGATSLPKAAAALSQGFMDIIKTSSDASANFNPLLAGGAKSYLLSQAFPEGSPTHPAYPTGHGTVAGACITALKFFFDGSKRIVDITTPKVASDDGSGLDDYTGADANQMDINGELHKLAHNISFGHGLLAGIHWRTDTDESMLLGEKVAIACLNDLVATYSEKVSVTIKLMNGSPATISN